MSTRGIIGFQISNKIKGTYNHTDMGPKSKGEGLVKILSRLSENDIALLKEKVEKLRWVNRDDIATQEDIEKYSQFLNLRVSNQKPSDWYCLLRKAQTEDVIKFILSDKLDVLIDETDFLQDSKFCEWAYIINFDDGMLDTYEGFQFIPCDSNLLGTAEKDGCYPCKITNQTKFCDLHNIEAWLANFKEEG